MTRSHWKPLVPVMQARVFLKGELIAGVPGIRRGSVGETWRGRDDRGDV